MYDEPSAPAFRWSFRTPLEVTVAYCPAAPAKPSKDHSYTETVTTPRQALRIMRRSIRATLSTLTPEVRVTTEAWLASPEEFRAATRELGCEGEFQFSTGAEPPYLTAIVRYAGREDPPAT